MENAVDALKMAFAVFVFVMALSLAIYMFSEARTTADAVLYGSDSTRFMDYEEAVIGGEDRIVGLETIIPTLYKYYKENYTVIFRDNSGYMELYKTKTDKNQWSNYVNKYYTLNDDMRICSFDVDEETRRREPWTGSQENYKKNLDAFLSGGIFEYASSYDDGTGTKYDYSNRWGQGGFIQQFKGKKFRENLGEYVYNSSTSDHATEMKKRVIIYTLDS